MCRRLRGQARSHRFFVAPPNHWSTRKNCGSEPARESGGSGEYEVECDAAFASRLAPTEVVAPPNHWSTRNIVGASLLAKAVDQPAKILDVPPSSRASPLPQGLVAPPNQWSTRNIVGASLLAKALDQPAKMLNVPPSSRASPLPQGFCGTTKSLVNTEHCGSELARESGGSAGKDVECAAVFASRLAPTGNRGAADEMGWHSYLT